MPNFHHRKKKVDQSHTLNRNKINQIKILNVGIHRILNLFILRDRKTKYRYTFVLNLFKGNGM
jgi:hypothetical protein